MNCYCQFFLHHDGFVLRLGCYYTSALDPLLESCCIHSSVSSKLYGSVSRCISSPCNHCPCSRCSFFYSVARHYHFFCPLSRYNISLAAKFGLNMFDQSNGQLEWSRNVRNFTADNDMEVRLLHCTALPLPLHVSHSAGHHLECLLSV